MRPKGAVRRAETFEFITRLYDGDLHAKRVLSLANGTLGVLSSASLAVHAVGQGLTRLRQYDWGCEIENSAKPWTYESINPMLL